MFKLILILFFINYCNCYKSISSSDYSQSSQQSSSSSSLPKPQAIIHLPDNVYKHYPVKDTIKLDHNQLSEYLSSIKYLPDTIHKHAQMLAQLDENQILKYGQTVGQLPLISLTDKNQEYGDGQMKMNDDYSAPIQTNSDYQQQNDQQDSYGANQQDNYGANQQDSYGANQQDSYGSNQQDSYGTNQQDSYGSNQQDSYGANQQDSYGANQQDSYGSNQQDNSGQSYTANNNQDYNNGDKTPVKKNCKKNREKKYEQSNNAGYANEGASYETPNQNPQVEYQGAQMGKNNYDDSGNSYYSSNNNNQDYSNEENGGGNSYESSPFDFNFVQDILSHVMAQLEQLQIDPDSLNAYGKTEDDSNGGGYESNSNQQGIQLVDKPKNAQEINYAYNVVHNDESNQASSNNHETSYTSSTNEPTVILDNKIPLNSQGKNSHSTVTYRMPTINLELGEKQIENIMKAISTDKKGRYNQPIMIKANQFKLPPSLSNLGKIKTIAFIKSSKLNGFNQLSPYFNTQYLDNNINNLNNYKLVSSTSNKDETTASSKYESPVLSAYGYGVSLPSSKFYASSSNKKSTILPLKNRSKKRLGQRSYTFQSASSNIKSIISALPKISKRTAQKSVTSTVEKN